jgi:hypothetical protein
VADYDDDGDADIAIANDQLPGDLYKNDGKDIFKTSPCSPGPPTTPTEPRTPAWAWTGLITKMTAGLP